jgi:phosphate transport system substrate-binding protein
MSVWTSAYQKSHPGVEFDLVADGSGTGLRELIDRKTDMAMISGDIPGEIDSLLWITPVCRSGIVFIINPENPYLADIVKKGLNREALSGLFSGTSDPTWGKVLGTTAREQIHVYVRSDTAGATDYAAKYLWLEPSEFKGTRVNGEEEMIDAVRKDPLALGYCNVIYTFNIATREYASDIRIVPLDVNHNGRIDDIENFYGTVTGLHRAMWTGKYPCPLTRNLFLATLGEPASKEISSFL